MSLPPILYHYFKTPLPYIPTLALQEALHSIQLKQRRASDSHQDILLLLQHRPVYTGGRRQPESELAAERARLTNIGADFLRTQRGGQLTYHGPGQLVGYPLLDLGRTTPAMGIRDYICRMQKMIENHLQEAHGIAHIPSKHTGVFLNATTKVGSIGVQVRHRLTTHGFAFNVTSEPIPWFDEIVACGLADVKAGCIERAARKAVNVEDVVPDVVNAFGRLFERDMEKLEVEKAGEVGELIAEMEDEARKAGQWSKAPSPVS